MCVVPESCVACEGEKEQRQVSGVGSRVAILPADCLGTIEGSVSRRAELRLRPAFELRFVLSSAAVGRLSVRFGSMDMSKSQDQKKDTKKKAVKTPKEKRAEKDAKRKSKTISFP